MGDLVGGNDVKLAVLKREVRAVHRHEAGALKILGTLPGLPDLRRIHVDPRDGQPEPATDVDWRHTVAAAEVEIFLAGRELDPLEHLLGVFGHTTAVRPAC